MKFRWQFDGRSVTAPAALILFCCTSITMLLAQASSAPTQPNSSAAEFPEAGAYASTKLTSSQNWIAVKTISNPTSTRNESKNMTTPHLRKSTSRSPLRLGFLLIALAVSLTITARANGPRDLISSSAARSHGTAAVQQPASPLIKALPTHPLWSDDTILYDNGGPNQQDGNEMTQWIQAEDFNLSADSTLMTVNFWDIEAPGGAAYQGEIDWTLYADAGGMPGAAFASGAAVGGDVTRTFIQGGVLGFFDEYSDSFIISPGVALTAGTTYWLGLHNGPLTFTIRSEFYWETTDFNGTFTGHEDDAPFDGVWFDNGMEHAFNLEGTTGGGGITLTATVHHKQGNSRVELSWSPADGGQVDVLRNGTRVHTTADDGSATNNVGTRTGTFTYQVCETDTGVCSNVVEVSIR